MGQGHRLSRDPKFYPRNAQEEILRLDISIPANDADAVSLMSFIVPGGTQSAALAAFERDSISKILITNQADNCVKVDREAFVSSLDGVVAGVLKEPTRYHDKNVDWEVDATQWFLEHCYVESCDGTAVAAQLIVFGSRLIHTLELKKT